MTKIIEMMHRWVCITCELTSPWSNDVRLVHKEAEAHTKGTGHATNSYMVPKSSR